MLHLRQQLATPAGRSTDCAGSATRAAGTPANVVARSREILGAADPQADVELLAMADQLLKELGIADVTTFVGQVDHQGVPAQLAEIDIYVALSRLDSESFGVAVLEASAMALPVVVSDAGGLPEVVVDGQTGIVVKRDDPAAAAAALEELVLDPERRTAMGAAGRRHVEEKYSWGASVELMESVYRSLLPGAAARESTR